MRGELAGVPTAIRLSRRTYRTILQNLGWAFAYNVALIPLAAAGLLNPIIAGAAMGFSSVSVVANSLRLLRFTADATPATKPRRQPTRRNPARTGNSTLSVGELVRVHLHDGGVVEGHRRSSTMLHTPVLLLDPTGARNPDGSLRLPRASDGFLPEAHIARVEPLAPTPGTTARIGA